MKPLAIVVAMNPSRVIGVNGDLPWRFREDLRHFKRTTMGHAIIMGRKTWDSIGRPLPGRRNIVISRNINLSIEGCDVVHSVQSAIDLARQGGDECPMIIGGSTIYAAALSSATKIYLTEVNTEVEGDTFFPELKNADWKEVERAQGKTPELSFVTLMRTQVN